MTAVSALFGMAPTQNFECAIGRTLGLMQKAIEIERPIERVGFTRQQKQDLLAGAARLQRIHRQDQRLGGLEPAPIDDLDPLGRAHVINPEASVAIAAAMPPSDPPDVDRTSDRECSLPSCCAVAS